MLGDVALEQVFIANENVDSYQICDQSEVVIGVDSSILYEALGRGKKTLFYSARVGDERFVSKRFGWPWHGDSEGPFWINGPEPQLAIEKIDRLIKLGASDWVSVLEIADSAYCQWRSLEGLCFNVNGEFK